MTVHRLAREFLSTELQMRELQMRWELRSLRDDCVVKLLLNPADAEGQPMPMEVQAQFRSWGTDPSVPAGEYHVMITFGG
jgi:hypothetical protein